MIHFMGINVKYFVSSFMTDPPPPAPTHSIERDWVTKGSVRVPKAKMLKNYYPTNLILHRFFDKLHGKVGETDRQINICVYIFIFFFCWWSFHFFKQKISVGVCAPLPFIRPTTSPPQR